MSAGECFEEEISKLDSILSNKTVCLSEKFQFVLTSNRTLGDFIAENFEASLILELTGVYFNSFKAMGVSSREEFLSVVKAKHHDNPSINCFT